MALYPDWLISVLIPVYNGEDFLYKALKSISEQTYKNLEIIVVNDGSTDTTESILWGFNDQRLQVITLPKNLGLISALNIGLKHCNGDWICRFDSDDIASRSLIEEKVRAAVKWDVGLINHLNWTLIDGKSRFNILRYYPNDGINWLTIIFDNTISHPGSFVSAETIQRLEYTNDGTVDYFEDVDLWSRFFANGGKSFTMRKKLLHYRVLSTGINKSKAKERIDRRVQYATVTLKLKENNALRTSLRAFYLGDMSVVQAFKIVFMLWQKFLEGNSGFGLGRYLDFFAWTMSLIYRRISMRARISLFGWITLSLILINPYFIRNLILNILSKE